MGRLMIYLLERESVNNYTAGNMRIAADIDIVVVL